MGSYLSSISNNRLLLRRNRNITMDDLRVTINVNDFDEMESDSDRDLGTILQYLITRGHLRYLSVDSEDEDDDDDNSSEDLNLFRTKRHYAPAVDPNPDTTVIDKSDLKTIQQHEIGSLNNKLVPSLPILITNREIGVNSNKANQMAHHFGISDRIQLSSRFIPSNKSKKTLTKYQSKIFCGFFSKSGDIFLSACQDTNIRIYDTKFEKFKLLKAVWAKDVGWSVLDTDLSPDGRHFIYSSWSENIHICNIYGDMDIHETFTLSQDDRRFCIFSVRFSQDGREIICGANDDSLYVYDRESQNSVLRIKSHDDDVNSVAFADSSSKILFSGGDDGLCKVWDRRTLNESNPKPVGILAGHIDGITYIDPRGDGRHLITNCKDQTIKLWDIRAFSPVKGAENTRKAVSKQNWDYRWQAIPRKLLLSRKKLDGDTSLMTYMGHSVLQTLVRCHFSPAATTGQRYIYTGCSTGRIVIYDVLTGKIVKQLNGHHGCVRDVSWHPYEPSLISTSWDGSVIKWKYIDESAFSSDSECEYYGEYCGLRRSKRLAEKRKRTQK